MASLQNQVEELRLQNNLNNQNFHECLKKVYEPLSDTIKNTCENLTKTMTENSIENKKKQFLI